MIFLATARAPAPAALVALALGACASNAGATAGLERLAGRDVRAAIEILGPPDAASADDGAATYRWTQGGAASAVRGGRVVLAPVACRLEISAADGRIRAAKLRGDEAACRRFGDALKELAAAPGGRL